MIDPKQLRKLTDEAIARGEQAHRQELARIAAENARKQRQAELLAESVIEQIPEKCEKEARHERSHAVVMGMKWDRDYPFNSGKNPQPNDLMGAGAIVWKYCTDAGLAPTIEFWHDGVGVQSGHNIVVHW